MSDGYEFLHNLHIYHNYRGIALVMLIRLPDATECYSALGAVPTAIGGCYFRCQWDTSRVVSED